MMGGPPRRRRSRWDPEAELPYAPAARGSDPAPLADLLGGVARRRKGWSTRLEGARVHGLWHEIAGDQLARHTEPVRLHGGVLVVRADSATWATQVRYLAAELAARVNAVLGEGQVTTVSVVSGPLKGTAS